jgi:degradative hydroxymethylglutaryl-CoA reductase
MVKRGGGVKDLRVR